MEASNKTTPPETTPAKPRRKWWSILRILGAYLVAAWTLLQFLEWFLKRNQISPYWVDLLLWIFLGILPSFLFYLYHKERIDAWRWKWKDRILFSGNLLLLALVLFLGFRTTDLGATTQEIEYVDADGAQQTKSILRQQYRTAVAVYDFTGVKEDSSAYWVGPGIRKLLALDLQQDHNLNTAGIGGNLTAAQKFNKGKENNEYTVYGTFHVENDRYLISPEVHAGKTGKLLATETFAGSDLLALLDSVSVFVRQHVGLSENQFEATADLPLAEYTSASPAAIKHFCRGYNGTWAQLERAIEADSTFALAAMNLGVRLYESDYNERDSRHYLDLAFRHRSKLPQELQYRLLGYWYLSQDKLEAAEEFLKLQLDINPQNAVLNQTMVRIYQKGHKFDELAAFTESWASRDLSNASGIAAAHALHLRAEPDRLLQLADPLQVVYPNDYNITFHQFKANLIAANWEEAEKILRTAEVTWPELQAQYDLCRTYIEDQRKEEVRYSILEELVGEYRMPTSERTLSMFSVPWHSRALLVEGNNFLWLQFPGSADRSFSFHQWGNAWDYRIIRDSSGSISRLTATNFRGINAKGREFNFWREGPLIEQVRTLLRLGDHEAALSACEKAIEQFPDHYYLRDILAHLRYRKSISAEALREQLASVVGTYNERNFSLTNGKLFYKRQDLDEAANRYYPRQELLPLSATTYFSLEKLNTRMVFDYRADGAAASYSEVYEVDEGAWSNNTAVGDYKLKDQEAASR